MDAVAIEADEYYVNSQRLYIIPTEMDIVMFNNKLTKPLDNGLRAFKLNSSIGKKWVKFVKENYICILHKPFVSTYFSAYGKTTSRLFNIGNIIYCSFKSDINFNTPAGFIEIKASEFYKAIEDDEN